MTQESESNEYYPFRWKVADFVEDIFLLHRTQAIGFIALLGLGFIILGFFLLGWGNGNTRTDTASPSSTIPATSSPAANNEQSTTAPSTSSTTSTTATSSSSTTSTTTTTVAPTTTAPTTTVPASTRPVPSPEQIAAAEPGAVIELTPQAVRLVGGVSTDAEADALVDLAGTVFDNLEVEDLQLVDDSFAPLGDSPPLLFRLSAPDLFGYNSDALNTTYLPLIDQIAGPILDNPTWQVEVSGHTDASGPAPGNQRLSERRAASAAQRLLAQGVPAAQVSSVGRGEDQPIASNDTEAGKLANRRVEFLITR